MKRYDTEWKKILRITKLIRHIQNIYEFNEKTNKPITKVGGGQKHLNRHFAKKDNRWQIEHMKRCSTSSFTGEMLIKTTQ